MNEEILQKMKLEVDQLTKLSTEQTKTILLLLGAVRALSLQLDKADFRQKVQMAIQEIPFDVRIAKGDQDRMKVKTIELIPVYFP